MRMNQAFLPLLAATVFFTGCSSDKDPATRIVDQAEAALEDLRPTGTQFAPDEFSTVEATVADLKAKHASEDYRAVVNAVPRFNEEMRAVKELVISNQTMAVAAQREWELMVVEVPKTVEAVQARVDSLTRNRSRDITRETLATAKTELESMKTTWAKATAAATAGDTREATDKGRAVQSKVEELKTQLGMNPAVAAIATPATAPRMPAN